jgi:hypothetical protein
MVIRSSYTVIMRDELLDGVGAYATISRNGGTNWLVRERAKYMLRPPELNTYTKTNTDNTVDKGREFSANMYVAPTIAPKSTLNTSGEIGLDGSVTINMGYL